MGTVGLGFIGVGHVGQGMIEQVPKVPGLSVAAVQDANLARQRRSPSVGPSHGMASASRTCSTCRPLTRW